MPLTDRLTTEPTLALVELLDRRGRIWFWCPGGRAHSCRKQRASLAPTDSSPRWAPSSAGNSVRRSTTLSGQAPPEFAGPLVAQLESIGLVDALLTRYDGRLAHHAPWHLGHETDVMMHGQVDVDDVEKWLTSEGIRG